MANARHFLGIDAGGSKTLWCCVDEAGAVLATGRTHAAQPAAAGVAAAAEVLSDVVLAVEREHGPAAMAVIGAAGAGSSDVRAELAERLRARGVRGTVRFCGDPEVAAATALEDGPGVAVWAGTGSFVIARRDDGALLRGGGRGYLLGDQGSGFALVRAAATAAVEALDGIGPETALGPRLVEAFGAAVVADLGGILQRSDSRAVASRAPVVLETAASGDPVASRIVDEQASALAALVTATAARADVAAAPCVAGGGLLIHVPLYRRRVEAALGAPLVPTRQGAEFGAVRLAMAIHRGERPFVDWLP